MQYPVNACPESPVSKRRVLFHNRSGDFKEEADFFLNSPTSYSDSCLPAEMMFRKSCFLLVEGIKTEAFRCLY